MEVGIGALCGEYASLQWEANQRRGAKSVEAPLVCSVNVPRENSPSVDVDNGEICHHHLGNAVRTAFPSITQYKIIVHSVQSVTACFLQNEPTSSVTQLV